MIHIVYKEIIIKAETKDKLIYLLKPWIDIAKKNELNLSFDVCWKNENTLIIVQRWSNQAAYNNFMKSEEAKKMINNIEAYIDYTAKVERLNTIC
ncbi:putative quinol monooxygenase [Mycoplasmopsis primatum]|uniref:putative quinol monooxygenase n=1 Tax=Mycoplasmopsis primatum TaxID=55604 RepID=UPI00049644CC|nr:antibiotic biosynthesis monooxygenase [Mycoplasmopsis primatum]